MVDEKIRDVKKQIVQKKIERLEKLLEEVEILKKLPKQNLDTQDQLWLENEIARIRKDIATSPDYLDASGLNGGLN